MAKKQELSTRQRQSQRIMREKMARKKREALRRRVVLIGGGVLTVTLTATSLWAWKSGAAERAEQAVSDKIYGITVKAGFAVRSVYLDGRSRTSMADIEKAMNVQKGDPILRISLDDVRQHIEQIESVKFATVERELPGALYVHIVEREPVALWQNQGKLALLDDNGVVMTDLDVSNYQHLPLLVGNDAPSHISEILSLLNSEPELAKRFASAIRVGDRRWNIRLSGGSEIKLPEEDPQTAWKTLADMQQKQQLLDRDVKVIDLRVGGRLFIKLSPEIPSEKSSNAKET